MLLTYTIHLQIHFPWEVWRKSQCGQGLNVGSMLRDHSRSSQEQDEVPRDQIGVSHMHVKSLNPVSNPTKLLLEYQILFLKSP